MPVDGFHYVPRSTDLPKEGSAEPVKKLPYACRDFKNGKCTRGENCRFLHVLERKGVGGK